MDGNKTRKTGRLWAYDLSYTVEEDMGARSTWAVAQLYKASYIRIFVNSKLDGSVKSPNSDGFVKSSRSRLANPEE